MVVHQGMDARPETKVLIPQLLLLLMINYDSHNEMVILTVFIYINDEYSCTNVDYTHPVRRLGMYFNHLLLRQNLATHDFMPALLK